MTAPSAASDRSSALDFLYGRINYERTSHIPYHSCDFKLDRMWRLLAGLGNPHLTVPAVHITGTKGKGSTAAMISSVLREAGYKTALYTSPHLERLEERFVINGEAISETELTSLAAEVSPVVAEMDRCLIADDGQPMGPTFFEITTAMAFLHFARQRAQIAVLEVGLGGRLDSTNVCQPEVCAITSISFDHMKQLGNTLAAIAGEKAGIIKAGIPIVSGVMASEPRDTIAQRAAAVSAPLFQRGTEFDFRATQLPAKNEQTSSTNQKFDYFEPAGCEIPTVAGLEIGLFGRHQLENAAVAVATLQRLVERGWNIPAPSLRRGLAAATCPARIELLGRHPWIVVDVAHNVASMQALGAELHSRFPARKKTAIFATSRDKDLAGILRALLPAFDTVVLTRYINNPRALETAELLSLAQNILAESTSSAEQRWTNLVMQPTPAAAWNYAKSLSAPSDLICVTGSFFLAGDLLPIIRSAAR